MKKLLLILSLTALACSLPVRISLDEENADLTVTPTFSAPTQTPPPPAIGTEKNPLILALAPSPHANPEMIEAGEKIAAFIAERTGYRVVTIAPSSETNLVEALDKENAHIARLSPFGYAWARENDSVTVIFASARNEKIFYGAQFIANRDSEFTPFFDPARKGNTSDASAALKQFQDKKPCWSDALSPSGYVVPLGVLGQNQVQPLAGAFLGGQANVVRAVYAGDICNFGATYIDARELPTLEANYPDVKERVKVIWRVPEIIPYETFVVSNALPLEMRRAIQRALIDLVLSPEHKTLLQEVYGVDEIQVAEDSMYAEFHRLWKDSGLDISILVE